MALTILGYVIKQLNVTRQSHSFHQEVVAHTGKADTREIKLTLANEFIVEMSTERKRWAITLDRYPKRPCLDTSDYLGLL